MVATITLENLIEKGACLDYREEFKKLFGDSVEVTAQVAEECARSFNWHWAAENLLKSSELYLIWHDFSQDEWNKYIEKRDEMAKKLEPFHHDDSYRSYRSYRVYNKKRREFYNKYQEVIARKFAELYIQENS